MRDTVEMPKRQHELDRQRKKREPRALLDVRAEPLHADEPRNGWPRGRPMLYYNITELSRMSTAVRLSAVGKCPPV
jgi:hypothetical protein